MKTRGKRYLSTVVTFSVIVCSLLIALPRCTPAKRDEIIIAANIAKTTLLLYVADTRRLFEKNGLTATVKMHQSGPVSLKELEEGRADVACVADFAFVTKSFNTGNLKVIGAIARSVGAHIIARRDSGITKPAGLVGKSVAVPKGTIAEFFVGAYCERNGVPYQALHIVYLSPADMVEAIRKGTVNAACVWSPFIDQIEGYLGDDAVLLPSQGRKDYYLLLVTRDDVLREKPTAVERLLKTMIEAETLVREHPDEAMQIIAKETGLTMAQVRGGWPEEKYEVRMGQDLLTIMEAEAQWMIRNNLTSKKEMPNYLDVIYLKALEAVKPEAVGIIH